MSKRPVKPLTEGPHTYHHAWIHDLLTGVEPLIIAGKGITVSIDVNGKYIITSTATASGGGGFQWQNPKELDPTKSVSKDTFVYISPANPIVTTGLTDLTTGTLIQAMPGIWQALQTVPAQVTVGGVTKYNVPSQIPTGAVSGSPSNGDADNPAAFWIPWAGVMQCG